MDRQQLIRLCLDRVEEDGEDAVVDIILSNEAIDQVIDMGGWTRIRGKGSSYYRFFCAELLDYIQGDNDG